MPDSDQRFDAFALLGKGEPLSFQIARGRLNQKPVSLVCFALDARAAEWTREQIEHTIAIACANNSIRFSRDGFRRSLIALWVQAGRRNSPQCWAEMKKRFIDRTERHERHKARELYGNETTDN